MKDLNTLTEGWKTQTASDLLPEQFQSIKNKQSYTIVVLSITMVILIAFAIWVFNPEVLVFNIGMALMIISLVVRIILEMSSIKENKSLKLNASLHHYFEKIQEYHQNRLKTHQVWTPVLLATYWLGFVLLIPTFKTNLSDFMFQYVCWSSIPIAVVMVWLIAREVKKEKLVLRQIKSDLSK
ncbi:hypothetical protein BST97_11660 [Nonlabens spongiae]|uniref:Uncharacterized protein n=1 Tax=Nonlabens spongiae TaxID=331648 RepID=A0A1W6MLW9_9FLAO|nr:hypothetical protein [Nonlabens spongiae]ARN78590.1 hypothetical protein BST97_11660 [Nonlabens spongiae]